MSGAVGIDDYNNIPTNWEETLNQMNGGQLSSQANDILATMNKIDMDAYQDLDDAYSEHFGKSASQAGSYQALQGKAYNDTAERFAKQQDMIEKIDVANAITASVDLNSHTNAEMAILLYEQMKVHALAEINTSQQKLEDTKTRHMVTKHYKDDF